MWYMNIKNEWKLYNFLKILPCQDQTTKKRWLRSEQWEDKNLIDSLKLSSLSRFIREMSTVILRCSLRMIYCGVHLIKKLYKLMRELKILLKWQLEFKKLVLLALHPIKLIKNLT